MKGVKQVQNLIKLAEFSQKQWENMIIDIKWRFHQQPHDRPRWICPVYSRGGRYDDLRTYKSCDKRRKPWGNPDGKSYWHWHYLHRSQSVWCRETGLHQLWIACGQASSGDGFLSMNCVFPLGHRRAGAFTPSPITGFDVVSTFCDKGKKM